MKKICQIILKVSDVFSTIFALLALIALVYMVTLMLKKEFINEEVFLSLVLGALFAFEVVVYTAHVIFTFRAIKESIYSQLLYCILVFLMLEQLAKVIITGNGIDIWLIIGEIYKGLNVYALIKLEKYRNIELSEEKSLKRR
ncbi:MAG: hypothetical protein IJ809_03155 [Clostridia bacterium]|nr:hypothetical protein [Clostridia bacterium]